MTADCGHRNKSVGCLQSLGASTQDRFRHVYDPRLCLLVTRKHSIECCFSPIWQQWRAYITMSDVSDARRVSQGTAPLVPAGSDQDLIQNGLHFPDDISNDNFFDENCHVLMQISPKFVPKGPIVNKPALVQIMAWRRTCDKPLAEPMMDTLLTQI